MQTELRQARNVAIVVGIGLLLLIVAALIWGQSDTGADSNQTVKIGNTTSITLLKNTSLNTIEENFWRYTDERLGFAIDIPKSMWYYGLACEKDEQGYYHLTEGKAPVRVFQNEASVTIAPQYSYVLQGEEAYVQEEGYHSRRFTDCQKVENTSAQLEQQYMGWEIISKKIGSEEELGQALRQVFGEGCSFGGFVDTSKAGVFDVLIQSDGLDLGETLCPLNQTIYAKYSPDAQRFITWRAGQEATYFIAGPDEQVETSGKANTHDQRMVESLDILTSM